MMDREAGDRDAALESDAPSWSRYSPSQRRRYLAILFLVTLSCYVDRHVVSVLVEPIKREFQVSDTAMGLLGGFSFAAFYAVLGLPIARYADRGDRRQIITIALTIWSVATLLCGFARTFPQLLAARVGVGAGEAGAFPPAQSLIADYFPPRQRARALAVFTSSATAGYLLAFIGGARIAADHGWRDALIVLGLPGLLLAVLTWFGLSEPRRLPGRAPVSSPEPMSMTLRVLAGKRSYVLLCVSLVLYYFVAYGAVTWIPAYLVRVMKLDLRAVGLGYGSVAALAALVGTLLGGYAMDFAARGSAQLAVRLAAAILVGIMPVYVAAVATDRLWLFYTLSFVGAAGLTAAVPMLFTIILNIAGPARRATAVAIILLLANLFGLGFGPLITGAVSDHFSAEYGDAGLRYALMVSFCLLLPVGAGLWAAGRHVEGDTEHE